MLVVYWKIKLNSNYTMSDDGSVNTVNTATVKNQFAFSHLFPAHLYIKNADERTGG